MKLTFCGNNGKLPSLKSRLETCLFRKKLYRAYFLIYLNRIIWAIIYKKIRVSFIVDNQWQESFCLKSISNNAGEALFVEYVVCICVISLKVVGPNLWVSWAVSNDTSHRLCLVVTSRTLSCLVVTSRTLSCLVVTSRTLSCLVVTSRTLSCLVVTSRTLSCLVVTSRTLICLVVTSRRLVVLWL